MSEEKKAAMWIIGVGVLAAVILIAAALNIGPCGCFAHH